ncbi:MAG: lysophospholipid acyltransferase family protein [Acidobacteriota bacterium]
MQPAPLLSRQDVLAADLPEMPGRRRAALKALMIAFGPLIEVEKPERIAVPGPVLFALNHNNATEAVLVPAALMWLRDGALVSFLADWMYLHVPGVGWLLREGGVIPVFRKPARWNVRETYRRERLKEPVLEACLERLAAGDSIGIFPEGTRNPDPDRLLRGRSGLGELALRSSAPVVPVGIRYPAADRLGRAPKIGRTVLVPGEPLRFESEREAGRGASPRDRRALSRRIVERVMSELAGLSGKAIPQSQEDLS